MDETSFYFFPSRITKYRGGNEDENYAGYLLHAFLFSGRKGQHFRILHQVCFKYCDVMVEESK